MNTVGTTIEHLFFVCFSSPLVIQDATISKDASLAVGDDALYCIHCSADCWPPESNETLSSTKKIEES